MRLFFIVAVMLLAFSANTMGQERGRNPIYEVDEYEVLSFVIDSLVCRHPFFPGAIIAVDQAAHCYGWNGTGPRQERCDLLKKYSFKGIADSTIEQICTDLDKKCAESSRWVLSFHFRNPYIWAHPIFGNRGRIDFEGHVLIRASRVAFDDLRSLAYCSIFYDYPGGAGGGNYSASLLKVDGKWTFMRWAEAVE